MSARHEVARAMSASVWRMDGAPMEHLLKVRNEIGPHAPSLAKYGILYTSGWFVLWTEGRNETIVDGAMARAGMELRNEQQVVLHRSRGPARLHERIIVAATQTPLRATEFARWVMHMRDEGPSLEPVDIWNRLGAPCLIDPSKRPCTRPVQQFALIAADDHGPVDRLRALSERFTSPIVYQRFGVAQLRSPDMGMAYVDLPMRGGAARVRVMSGRAMSRPAVRNSMPELEAIVVLVGQRPAATIELVTNVAQAVQRMQRQPIIWLAGATGDLAVACARLLERFAVPSRIVPAADTARQDLLAMLGLVGLRA
jgi:hypothetical protein